MMSERLDDYGINRTVRHTRLKIRVLENFPNLKEERGVRDYVFLVCSSTARDIISHACQKKKG